MKRILPVSHKQWLTDLGTSALHGALRLILTPLEHLSGQFITIRTRPKFAKDVRIVSDARERDYSEYAIVLQGPIVTKERFTIETLLLYKKNFPGAMIVLSTWEDQDARTIQEARDAGVEIVMSKPLERGGINNINRQIVSSRAGVAFAKEAGKTYIAKTRADQRFYTLRLLTLLSGMLIEFPAREGVARGRIIGMSLGGERKKIYLFPDHLLFGYAEDIERYFSAPLVEDDSIKLPFLDPKRPFTSEGYMFAHYMKSMHIPIATNEEEYFLQLARHFAFIDVATVDWYWYKYRRFDENRAFQYGYQKDLKVDFALWLELYAEHKDRFPKGNL